MERKTSILSGTVGKAILAGIMAFSWNAAEAQNSAPYFSNPSPSNNTTYTVQVGDTVEFQVRGKDTPTQLVTLSSSALPTGAMMIPALPISNLMTNNGSHVKSKFRWVPTTADTGLNAITFTLTDNGSTPLTATRTINIMVTPAPCTLNVQAMAQNITCNGANNGSITTTVAQPYSGTLTYTWSNNATTQNLNNLMPGTYTVTVMDANGCTGSATATVSQPSPINITGTVTNFSCTSTSNGAINLSVSGGTGAYTYSWSNSSTNQNLTGLQPGTYTVTVTDANMCTSTSSFTVNQPTAAALSITGTTSNFTCNNTDNGMVDISVSGGATPYTYSWSNNDTTQDLSGVQQGTYTVTVTDANMCSATASFTVNPPLPGTLINSVTVNPTMTVPGQQMNTIYLGYGPQTVTLMNALGGAGFTYNWTTTTDTTSLGTGGTLAVSPTMTTSYIVSVMDSLGCMDTDTVTIHVVDVRCGTNNNKVSLCHKANGKNKKTLCIDSTSVAGHLAHGDMLGNCPPVTPGSTPGANAKMNTTGLNELTVYPNPTTGTITLLLPEYGENVTVVITDISGKMVKTVKVGESTGSELRIDLAGNSKGIYFVEVVTRSETYRTKVLLQ